MMLGLNDRTEKLTVRDILKDNHQEQILIHLISNL